MTQQIQRCEEWVWVLEVRLRMRQWQVRVRVEDYMDDKVDSY